MVDVTSDQTRTERLEWLARVYSEDGDAVRDEVADAMLVEHNPAFHVSNFAATYRPLRKFLDQQGPVTFEVTAADHAEPDRTYASFSVDGTVIFEVIVRFETNAPYRIMYWMSHPPLPAHISIRPYTPSDAPGCVALEQACPMEMLDGSQWTIDRGTYFDDYLSLMHAIDAAVAIDHAANDKVIGFFSCALRPIRYQEKDTFCVYQHHYRVHPDYRAGSVSQALATFVDPRRTFAASAAQFPYSFVDPNNAHLQHMGLPEIENVHITRLALAAPETSMGPKPALLHDHDHIATLINTAHQDRSLFIPFTAQAVAERLARVASYNPQCIFGDAEAFLGIWPVAELNVQDVDGVRTETRMHFVLDYGFTSIEALARLVGDVLASPIMEGATHLGFLCDQRAPEYPHLQTLATDEQTFAVHTLPFTQDAFAAVVYCDAIYC
ncbi:MAG: hypothetical protein AAF513_00155 [Pseudomonadota bacterium]